MYAWHDGTDYLAHHGIKGQKWGVRRFQNEDGSYTELGRKRRGFGKSMAEKNAEQARMDIQKYGGRNAAKVAIRSKAENAEAAASLFGFASSAVVAGAIAAMAPLMPTPLSMLAFAGPTLAGGVISLFIDHYKDKRIAAIQDSDYGHDITVNSEKKQIKEKESDLNPDDIPKQAKSLSSKASSLRSTYGYDAQKHYDDVGGANLWNRLAKANTDYERNMAFARSVIEEALRTGRKPSLSEEESKTIGLYILDGVERQSDESVASKEMTLADAFLKRFEENGEYTW